jgi:hypothetical protein
MFFFSTLILQYDDGGKKNPIHITASSLASLFYLFIIYKYLFLANVCIFCEWNLERLRK